MRVADRAARVAGQTRAQVRRERRRRRVSFFVAVEGLSLCCFSACNPLAFCRLLLELSAADLRDDLGVISGLEQKKIMLAIEKLKKT